MRLTPCVVGVLTVFLGSSLGPVGWAQPPGDRDRPNEPSSSSPPPDAGEQRTLPQRSVPAYPPPPEGIKDLKSQPTGEPAYPPPDAKGPCGTWVLVPPQFQTRTEQALVKPAGKSFEWVPPRYEMRTQQVLVTPARTRIVPIPGVIETESEQVLVKPGGKEWRLVPCTDLPLAPGELQGASWCLVDVPPQFETKTKQVVKAPPSFKKEEIPAVYKTIEVEVLASDGQWKEVTSPPAFETRTRTEKVAEARWEWRSSTVCKEARVMPPPPPPPKAQQHIHRNRCGCDPRGRD